MAQRGKSDGRGRRSARPTSGRRVDGRREQRGDGRRGDPIARDARSARAAEGRDADEVGTQAGSVDEAPTSGRGRGLSPKRAVVLALVLSVVALTLAVPLRTYFSQRSEFEQLRSTNSAVQKEVSDYQAKVDAQSDPAYIEAQARDRLQFVMPGDKAVVMQFPSPPEKSDEQKRAEAQAGNPWYTNLLQSVSTPPGK